MKRFISAALAARICFSFVACGGNSRGSQPEINSENTRKSTEVNIEQQAPKVQEISAFLDGIKPYYDRVIVLEDGGKYRIMNYNMLLGREVLIEQYIAKLIDYDYGISLDDIYTKEQDEVTYTYYYLKYDGDSEKYFGRSDLEYHINIAVCEYKYTGEIEITLGYAEGFEYVDDGHRADFSQAEIIAPVVTPSPTPETAPESAPTPTKKPASTVVPDTEKADKNTALIPDFSAFLNRYPSEEKDRYYGGNRKYYQNIPLETQDTVVTEVLELLNKDKYQLELIEKVEVSSRIEYNYRYTGNVAMDSIHSKNDDTRYYNLQFTVYNRYNDNGTYGIHFHYSPQFVEESIDYSVSVNIANGGSNGSGEVADFDPDDIPDASKLQCLTCDGDGDCTKCGGTTYVGFGDARAKCGTCRGTGNCRTCGGSGTRS